MAYFISWLILAILVGVYASSKGRSGIGFFFIAFLMSPILGFLIALVVKPIRAITDAKAVASGEFKKCPDCAELVNSEAIVCKHCGKDLSEVPAPQRLRPHPPADPTSKEVCYRCASYLSKGWDKSAGRCALQYDRVRASDTCESFTPKVSANA